MNTSFTPKMVGNPDHKTIKQITDLYEEIVASAEITMSYLDMLFNHPEGNNITFFMELTIKDPAILIRTKWVKIKEISIPGINTDKLIKSDLLNIPKYEEILVGFEDIKELYQQAKALNFVYPLEKLYNESTDTFELTEEFNSMLLNKFSSFTVNQKQNEILEVFEQYIDSLNKICNFKFIDSDNLTKVNNILHGNCIKPTHSKVTPFEINRNMFGGFVKTYIKD